jgi:hypothetical protein
LTRDGGEPKPTAVNSSTTVRTGKSSKQSIMARSVGQADSWYKASANA